MVVTPIRSGSIGGNSVKRFLHKVPGGKLVCVKVQEEAGIIKNIQYTGDFFMAPEGDLEELEARLLGQKTENDSVKKIIIDFFTEKKTVIAGASPNDFAFVLIQALNTTGT
jgi:lipoate-protein ligase A